MTDQSKNSSAETQQGASAASQGAASAPRTSSAAPPTSLSADDVRQTISSLDEGGGISSYPAFFDALIEELEAQGFVLGREETRLVRQVLRAEAPLGATDLDNRMAASMLQRPWYMAALGFILVCATGGIIEYFVQIPLDSLTGRGEPLRQEQSIDGGYRLSLEEGTGHAEVLARLILDDPRFELVMKAAPNCHASVGIFRRDDGSYRYRVTSTSDDRILDQGVIGRDVRDEVTTILGRLFPLEGYVLHVEDGQLWCDLGKNVGVAVGAQVFVAGQGRTVTHPKTGAVLSVDEIDLARATVDHVDARTCRARIVERFADAIPEAGDRVRLTVQRPVIRRPFRKRMRYDITPEHTTVTVQRQLTNTTTGPIAFVRGGEGHDSPFKIKHIVVNGVQGPPAEVVGRDRMREYHRLSFPEPVDPGETVIFGVVLESKEKPQVLPDGRRRANFWVGNTPAIDYIFVWRLPDGSRFHRASIPVFKHFPAGRNRRVGKRPVVIAKSSQGRDHHLKFWIEYEVDDG